MSTLKKRALLYVLRDSVQIYFEGSPEVRAIDLPRSIVDNLEVIDPEKCIILLNSFIEQNKLSPHSILFVLSEKTYFEKLIPQNDRGVEKSHIQQFLDELPYKSNETLKKTLRMSDGTCYVVAATKQFIELIAFVFAQHGWEIYALTPAFVLEKSSGIPLIMDKTNRLEPHLVQQLLLNREIDKLGNIFVEDMAAHEKITPTASKSQNNLILIGSAGILLLLLIIIVLLLKLR